MKPNITKTKLTLNLNEIKYLGVWLDPEIHILRNKEKSENTFKQLQYIFRSSQVSNGLKIILFKSIILSQLLYGLEIFNFNLKQIADLDVHINNLLVQTFRINKYTPVRIYRIEIKIPHIELTINRRKFNLKQKLKMLGLEKLANSIQITGTVSETIDWNSETIKKIDEQIWKSTLSQLEMDQKTKTRFYYNIIKLQNPEYKVQKYFNWKSSSIILKLRSSTNCFRRYSYVLDKKDKSQLCPICQKEDEDLDHVIWRCPVYQIFRDNLKENIQSMKVTEFQKIIDQESTLQILAQVNTKRIYKILIKFMKDVLMIRSQETSKKDTLAENNN